MSETKVITKQGEYEIDEQGFLLNPESWRTDFAEAMASRVDLPRGLSEKHWEVIRFIRDAYQRNGVCPIIYHTCRANNLSLFSLKELFPAGYLRGACKLAGVTYRDAYIGHYWRGATPERKPDSSRTYRVNTFGFLLDPAEWDETFAKNRAYEMKIPGGLTTQHWRVIRFLRSYFEENGAVPTVYQTCAANQLELEELERLFPEGYHRCAIKIAGLRVL